MGKAFLVLYLTVGLASLVILSASLFLTGTPLGLVMMTLHGNPSLFHRHAMEELVGAVRRSGIKPQQERSFICDNLLDPSTLHAPGSDKHEQRGNGAGRVWAAMSAQGNLQVVIETNDFGHAGEYGFAYSDVPLTARRTEMDGNWYTINVPSHLNLVQPRMQVDEHWWAVLYNLD